MPDEARRYSAGTRAALFHLARGTCYFPGCMKPVVEQTEGEHLVAVDIAHIKGANEGSARFDPAMTDAERAAFTNLILLCTTHHKLVDGPNSDKYPTELLQGWKAEHESDIGTLSGADVTAENLERVLETLMTKFGPIREVVVELEAMIWLGGRILKMPFRDLSTFLSTNTHYGTYEKGAVVTIRNIGTADVTVEDVALIHQLEAPTPEAKGSEVTLMGQNDYVHLQSVPHRLLSGDAMPWMTKSITLSRCERAAAVVGKKYATLVARVRLASGETLESPEVSWSSVSVLLDVHQDDPTLKQQ